MPATNTMPSDRHTAHRVQQHWRGYVAVAEPYLAHDLVLVDTDGGTAALIAVLVRDGTMQHHIEQRLQVTYETVRSLRRSARERGCVALILVVCDDDDFLLDLRDESGVTVRQIRYNENCLVYAGSRFLPLFTLPSLV